MTYKPEITKGTQFLTKKGKIAWVVKQKVVRNKESWEMFYTAKYIDHKGRVHTRHKISLIDVKKGMNKLKAKELENE